MFAGVCLSLVVLLFLSGQAGAVDIYPFYTFNQSPLIQIHGLPPIDNPLLMDKEKLRGMFSTDLANNFGVDEGAREKIVLDGESYRLTLGLRYGLVKAVETGIDIPFLIYGGGFLDTVIQGFHRAFGFSQNGRDKVPRNRLLFEYQRDNGEVFRMDHDNYGLGDIRLLAGVQLYRDEGPDPGAVALRASLKLPTGDSRKFRGSGSTDVALWLSGSGDYRLGSGHAALYGGVGGLYMGKGDVLAGQQRTVAGFGTMGIGWSPADWLAVKIQGDAHTPLYMNSQLVELNSDAAQFMFGFTFALPAKFTMDLAVIDDLIYTSASPDVAYHLALRRNF